MIDLEKEIELETKAKKDCSITCPHCGYSSDCVIVNSDAWQRAWLGENHRIDEYDSTIELEDTTGIVCIECLGDLSQLVSE